MWLLLCFGVRLFTLRGNGCLQPPERAEKLGVRWRDNNRISALAFLVYAIGSDKVGVRW
jgi:hypothetical protein